MAGLQETIDAARLVAIAKDATSTRSALDAKFLASANVQAGACEIFAQSLHDSSD